MAESCSFQGQLLSVMEVLAKAAVAEINRRVDDSCAVLRLELSRSRRDIDLLKGKCEVMEAELRRSRMRARRRGERFPPWVKMVSNRERPTDWDRPVEAEVHHQPQQCADMEPVNEAQHIQIKVECTEDDNVWKNDAEEKPIPAAEPPPPPCFRASQPVHPDSFVDQYLSAQSPAADTQQQQQQQQQPLVSPADGYSSSSSALTQQQQLLNTHNQAGTELLLVKHEKEEEPDENAAPLDSTGHRFMMEEGGGGGGGGGGGDGDRLWSSGLCRDTGDDQSCSSSFAGPQFEQIPAAFTPQLGLDLEIQSVIGGGKSHPVVVSASRAKRRVRTLTEDGHGSALSQINQSSVPQQWQHQCRTNTPAAARRSPGEEAAAAASSSSSSSSSIRGSFGLHARRMRAPWRSGIGEKRFSCTYCDKSFMRFSQLKEHLRSHTGEKPFSCLQCGRSFTKQCNLIRHAVVHSGEKPYECSLCGKCFTQRSSLKSHQKTAH